MWGIWAHLTSDDSKATPAAARLISSYTTASLLPTPTPPLQLVVDPSRACATDYAQLPTDAHWNSITEGLTLRKQPRKIVHFTVFDCEEWMLEIKLAEMAPSVHLFVIGEAAYSNANEPRAQCFPSILASNPRIAQYQSKIMYVYMQERVQNFVVWEAEVLYKNGVGHHFADSSLSAELADDDLAIFTDLDEILSTKFLEVLRNYDGFPLYIRASTRWSYYGFQWVNPNPTTVNIGVTWKALRDAAYNTNEIRLSLMGQQPPEPVFQGAYVGWHCSWCLPMDRFISKIEHSSALELNIASNKRLEFLQDMRMRGLWFADQQPNGCHASLDDASFAPQYVKANVRHLGAISVE